MAFCTVNGIAAIEASITLPRIGVWTADVELHAPKDTSSLSGSAMIALGDLSFSGTFSRAGLDGRGRLRARILGGANGLGRMLAPKSYLGTPLRIPLTDILTDAGEKLSAAADAATLAFQVPAWSRMQGIAGISLAGLVAVTAASWRVLSDGTVWVGPESWPTSSMIAKPLTYEPDVSTRSVFSLSPSALPGQTYQGQKVVSVTHLVGPRSLRTVLEIQ